MHQTTIRFDIELWRRIDEESRRIGVSAAQYIRDAALIRITHDTRPLLPAMAPPGGDAFLANASATISAASVIGTESRAVWAQARQARERAMGLRDASRRLAEARALRPWAGSQWQPPTADPT